MKKIFTAILLILCMSVTSTAAFAEDEDWQQIASVQVDTDTFDLRTPCQVTEEELEAVLKHELKGMAKYYLAAEEKYGVNAVFLASVSALESGWGRYCFKPNNIFGYGRNSFDSYAECIDFVASKISKNYLSEEGRYYSGNTIDAVNRYYNGREAWAETVKSIFEKMLEKVDLARQENI